MLHVQLRRQVLWALAAVVLLSQYACFGDDDEGGEEVVKVDEDAEDDAKSKAKKTKQSAIAKLPQTSEQELKLAKLWARVDEMEEQQARLKEKVRVLEKGFMLGLVPEELKGGAAGGSSAPPKAPAKQEPVDLSVELEPLAQKEPPKPQPGKPAPGKLSSTEQEEYQKLAGSAHDQFRAGRYGRAIVEYSEVGKKFGDAVEGGAHRFWIAKSWAALKELNTAKQGFLEFVEQFPTSPWAPRAKLELARVEWRLGLRDTAVKRLHDIIEKHPYEDAAEMAKMEIEQLDKSL
jgi:TolA-binding protein